MKSIQIALFALFAVAANAVKRQADTEGVLVIEGPIDESITSFTSPFNPQDIMKEIEPIRLPSAEVENNRNIRSGSVGRTSVTFFDDYQSVTGVDMYKYGNLNVQWFGRRVYPAAVHQNQASKFLYQILEITGKDMKPTLVQILDICDRQDRDCHNVSVYGYNMLVDLHKTGWKALGQDDGVLRGQYRIVGSVAPRNIPRQLWSDSIRSGTYALCKCSGSCSENEQVWLPLDKC